MYLGMQLVLDTYNNMKYNFLRNKETKFLGSYCFLRNCIYYKKEL